MTTPTPPRAPQTIIRFSRTIGLTRAAALGSSVALGLGVFIVLGLLLHQAGNRVPSAYLAATILFLPVILTYAERAAATPGSGGVFGLARPGDAPAQIYASGWLLLGGHLALIALLGWGAAAYLHVAIERLVNITAPLQWLAPAMVILVALNDILGTQGSWRLRSGVVYMGALLLLAIAVWSWWQPAAPAPALVAPPALSFPGIIALLAASLWGVQFVLDSRDELRQPERRLLPALLIPLLLLGGIGALVAISELRLLGALPVVMTPQAIVQARVSSAGPALTEAVYVFVGLLVCLIALDRAMVTMLRLIGAMVRDGFLPDLLARISPGFGTPLVALRLFAVGSALAAALAPPLLLTGLAALTFLWTTALLNASAVMGGAARLPPQRRLTLPLHPLFPVLAMVVSIFLSFALPPEALLVGAAWVLLGALSFQLYARQGAMAARRRDAMIGEVTPVAREVVYTVLVGIANPATAPALLRAGVTLARLHGGRVLALQVVVFPDQVPQYIQRQRAQAHLDDLYDLMEQAVATDTPVEALVRLAHSPVEGILGVAEEEQANMLVMGWEGERTGSFDLNSLLDPIVRAATCDVVVVRSGLPLNAKRILVPIAGSPNSLAALKLAQSLVDPQEGQIIALHLVQDMLQPNSLEQARRRVAAMIADLDGDAAIETRVLPATDLQQSILQASRDCDLLLLGASQGGALDQTIFGGLPVEVARESLRPVLLVKRYEGAPRFWARRLWETISAPFPTVALSERTEIYQQMRRTAQPRVDFFILIGLAAMIATLGLLQSSPAVIIGAMLVAPLMSPIIAIAMSIVHGNPRMLRVAAGATLLGIVLAISVSIAMTLATPARVNTPEILARTQPNLLDLFVALASGAAGGYAIGRKEVAAALPGVAIAAALVPPLGVVGYGTATAQFELAGGALLLFTTNLIAIVFAAAVVLLLLGFRPTRAQRREQVRLGFLASIAALISISIPLAIFSIGAMGQISRQGQVETVLNAVLESERMRITEFSMETQNESVIVHATIYALDEFGPAEAAALEAELSRAVGQPVTLRAMVLRAMMLPERGDVLLPTPVLAP